MLAAPPRREGFMKRFVLAAALALAVPQLAAATDSRYTIFKLPEGNYPHDVSPGPNGTIFYADQRAGGIGIVDPKTGKVEKVPFGDGSKPHGVITGPDGKAWLT